MTSRIGEPMLTAEVIATRTHEIAAEIGRDYAGKDLILIGVLKGALVFLVDLARAIPLPLAMDFMAVSSYGASTESSGVVRILKDLDDDIEGKDVLIVEDIVDSGLTLNYLVEYLRVRNPRSLRICSLLVKARERSQTPTVDYAGFTIPDRFVVGYGLDHGELYRNLPYVAELYLDE